MRMFPPFVIDSKPSPLLHELFSVLQIPYDGSFASMVEQGQKFLLRKKGVERWQLPTSQWEAQKEEIIFLLSRLGFINALIPEKMIYDYAIIFGFVSFDVQSQFDFLARSLDVRDIKQCVLLTSDLMLPQEYQFSHAGKTESEMMRNVYQGSALSHIPCAVITVPMKSDNRPTTEDTVRAWARTNPLPGVCVAVSAQPFIRRQTRILEAHMPFEGRVVPCGPSSQEESVALYLDELARALYEEQNYLEARRIFS